MGTRISGHSPSRPQRAEPRLMTIDLTSHPGAPNRLPGVTVPAPNRSQLPVDPPARATRPGPLLAVLLLGQFMAILDVAIVNVAAPTLRSDLHASGAGLQLSIAGYT